MLGKEEDRDEGETGKRKRVRRDINRTRGREDKQGRRVKYDKGLRK